MNKYILASISFVAGAVISGVSAWYVSKKRYERIHQEEMNAVWNDIRSHSEKKNDDIPVVLAVENDSSENADSHFPEKPDLETYVNRIRDAGYEAPDLAKTNDYIYEVDYSDLDEDEYERIDLTLYSDGILADDRDIPVKNPIEIVGEHYLDILSGKDEVFIRNERRQKDYDITRSMLTYGELLDRHPETEQKLQYEDALDNFYENEEEEDT